MVRSGAEHAGLQDRLGHFFDKEGHPIGALHHPPQHLGGQGFPPRETRHHAFHLRPRQPRQRHLRQVGTAPPWHPQRGATGHDQIEGDGRRLLHQEGQHLQRRGIDPVEVFDCEQRGVPCGEPQHHREDGFQRLVAPLLRRQGAWRIAGVRAWQRQESGQEWDRLVQRQSTLGQDSFKLLQLRVRYVVLLPLEDLVEQLHYRVPRTLLMVWRTPALQSGQRLLCGMSFQELGQA